MPRFVLNDETIRNSYGFKIRTKGISLERFKNNPVMLDGHNPSNLSVIGNWKDIKTDKTTLSAEPQFDGKDKNAKAIAGKVERGFIKGCSMGISFSKKDFVKENNEVILKKCELLEASIVSIPSNAGALRLYLDGELLNDTEAQELCLSIMQDYSKNTLKNENMDKIKLSQLAIIALGFAQNITEVSIEEINQAILSLQAAKEAAETKLQLSEEKVNAYLEKEKTEKQNKIAEMVSLAVKRGQITADKKQAFIDLANKDFDLAKSTIDAIPVKKNFSNEIQTPAGTSAVTTMDEFQKLSLSEQLAFKEADPEGYQAILKSL